MRTSITTEASDLAPIEPDWTIRALLDWLADDRRALDETLRHPLALIEAAATGSRWTGRPSTVALTRALVEAVRAVPSLAGTRVGDLPLTLRIARATPRPTPSEPSAPLEKALEAQVA